MGYGLLERIVRLLEKWDLVGGHVYGGLGVWWEIFLLSWQWKLDEVDKYGERFGGSLGRRWMFLGVDMKEIR